MNNYGFYNNFMYPIVVLPNFMNPRLPIYPTVRFFPQMIQPQESIVAIQNSFPQSNSNLQMQQLKQEQKVQQKVSNSQIKQKSQPEKIIVQIDQTFSRQFINKNEPKKANRPQTYLTEKAYYMKQKLKGKQINGARILRRRIKPKQQKFTKAEESEKKMKKMRETGKIITKKLPIAKDSEKQRKILMKIRNKIARQYCEQYAQIPKLISGAVQLNQFCKKKLQNLMLRQIKEE